MATMGPSHSAWDVQAAAGEPRAVVRVRNLQTTLGAGAAQDAWGRNGRPQPALLSAEVVLDGPFAEAAGQDRVAADTVHYGTLSKALLKSVARWDAAADETRGPGSLSDVLGAAWLDLTGDLTGGRVYGARRLDGMVPPPAPPIQADVVRSLTVSVLLPKASLVGDGVSLTATATIESHGKAGRPEPVSSTTLRLHRLRVPTLVGVHPHERTARQVVIADVALDAFECWADEYTALEALVVRTIEQSAFETLEALATHIARTVLTEFRPQPPPPEAQVALPGPVPDWYVHVALEKPIAVPFADAPVVEVRMGARHL